MISVGRCQPGLSTKLRHSGHRGPTSNPGARAHGSIAPMVALLEDRTLLATSTISTVAGNGTYGYTGDGGPATAAELKSVSSASQSTPTATSSSPTSITMSSAR